MPSRKVVAQRLGAKAPSRNSLQGPISGASPVAGNFGQHQKACTISTRTSDTYPARKWADITDENDAEVSDFHLRRLHSELASMIADTSSTRKWADISDSDSSDTEGSETEASSHRGQAHEHHHCTSRSNGYVDQPMFAKAVIDGPHTMQRRPSDKSISTDEGSLSSGRSSTAVSGDDPASFSPCSGPVLPKLDVQDGGCPPPTEVTDPVCAPPVPLWVDNGLKGDAAAWLLVLPKFPQTSGGTSADVSARVPRSPEDTLLLGPYVTTKNTFLEESRVGGPFGLHQRSRAHSWGACRRSLTS